MKTIGSVCLLYALLFALDAGMDLIQGYQLKDIAHTVGEIWSALDANDAFVFLLYMIAFWMSVKASQRKRKYS